MPSSPFVALPRIGPSGIVLCLSLAFSMAPGHAESLATSASSATSSASSAGSASLRGSSDSIQGSSNSSADKPKVSEGDYRVETVAEADGRIDTLRLTLQPLAADAREFQLLLPKRALADRTLAAGDLVHARIRSYGIEFRRGDSGKAFYLVLAEGWERDMETRPVAF